MLVLRQQQQLSDQRGWDLATEVAQLRADRQLLEVAPGGGLSFRTRIRRPRHLST